MAIRVVELDPADTFFSTRDRLLQGGRGRTVVLFPGRSAPLSSLDLVLLRRLADRERLDIGLVTANKKLSRQARALGLPSFANLTLAEHYRPGWWRARRRSEVLGFAPGDDRAPWARSAPIAGHDSKAGRRRGLARLAVFLTIMLVLALLFTAASYVLPRATLTLVPIARPAQVILTLATGSLQGEGLDNTVPAREIRHELEWTASGPVTADTDADRQRIRAQALQGLSAAAPVLLAARVAPGDMLVPESAHIEIVEEIFANDGTEARLTLGVALTGAAVAVADVNRIAYRQLAAALPDGYEPDASTLRLQMAPGGAEAGTFQITAQATGWPVIEDDVLAAALRGMRAGDATRYLNATVPLAEPPSLEVQPGWWWGLSRGRLPLRAEQIRVAVRP